MDVIAKALPNIAPNVLLNKREVNLTSLNLFETICIVTKILIFGLVLLATFEEVPNHLKWHDSGSFAFQ